VKHRRAAPAGVRVVILAAVLSLTSVGGALAQDPESVAAGSPRPVSSSPTEPGSPYPSASASPPGSPAASLALGVPDVTMLGSIFHPATIESRVGETVDWFNDDVTVHTVTALDGSFNSGIMVIGDTFSVTFTTPGTIDYICAIHPLMTGTIVVSE
jgi:plastocyanin